jgi:serine/threonine protein phosphatase PrpC
MFEIAYTQHSGHPSRDQQDALWNGRACVQLVDMVTRVRVQYDRRLLLAIADGVAVSPSPHLASRWVIKTLAALASDADLSPRLVRELHGRLCDRYATGRTLGTSTTLVAASCNVSRCVVTNVGDSRAYLIKSDGEWSQLSRDHSVLNDLIDHGQVDFDPVYAHLYDGLAHYLIADHQEDGFRIHQTSIPLGIGDRLLLCSDGVHDVLGEPTMQRLYKLHDTVAGQVDAWRRAVLAAGAPDNFSMILARRLSAPGPRSTHH